MYISTKLINFPWLPLQQEYLFLYGLFLRRVISDKQGGIYAIGDYMYRKMLLVLFQIYCINYTMNIYNTRIVSLNANYPVLEYCNRDYKHLWYKYLLNGSDDVVYRSGLLGSSILSIFRYSNEQNISENSICFRPQVKGRETRTLLGPLERAHI
jgi:hypothetical protein